MEDMELGGKRFAKTILINLLYDIGGTNIALLSTMIGLPKKLVAQLLYELEDQNRVRLSINGEIWKINEETMLQ